MAILLCGSLILLLASAWKKPSFMAAILFLFVAELALSQTTQSDFFSGFLAPDSFFRIGGHLVILGSAIFAVFCLNVSKYERKGEVKEELAALLLIATAGLLTLLAAEHFMVAYLALELVAVVLYIFIGSARLRSTALEASLKYFVLGATASAIMLYGMSLIYGFSGSLEFTAYSHTMSGGLAVGLVFFIFGLLFKLAVVPFHSWAPDVYEGAPTAVTAFLSSVPKVAVFLFLLKFTYQSLGEYQEAWQPFVAVLAALSMIVGGMAALRQSQIKRLLAYSSIGHVGFAMVALVGGGYGAAFIYMAVYMFMNLGLFAVLLAKGDKPSPCGILY